MPSGVEDPDHTLGNFKESIPALGLLGTPRLVDSSREYIIDDDVQLVCKYLQAYDSGNINRLYDDRKVYCF